ncbi:MAG: hypothetical protein KDK72_02560 [Chlamydiia bacterium]|nr:hypothetical protein [Chlamydiia bacterium]
MTANSISQHPIIFENGFSKSIDIRDKHEKNGITPEALEKMGKALNGSFAIGEHGNLWVRMNTAEFTPLLKGKNVKALNYLLPILKEVAKARNYSYVVVESNCASKVPYLLAKNGFKPRYMNTETNSQVNAIRIKEGEDKWPKFRAIKESVTAAIMVKNAASDVFVVIGQNKDNGARRGEILGTVIGYRNPNETFSAAALRVAQNETGLKFSETAKLHLIAQTYLENYYPGADDRNETRLIMIGPEELSSSFELKNNDGDWTLIQHEMGEVHEIKAQNGLAKVYVMPIQDALSKMNPNTSAYAKVKAAYDAISEGVLITEKTVSFGWKTEVSPNNDDVSFTAAGSLTQNQ